jgi:ABC-type Mn2+/Zn2+ transport system ATPase subunit
MTPGKQAMFALTLILSESEEAWPLLIDQPEDDLDSRSIYDVLVAYLARTKCERQIIMVTHDANLVIGADSEQVVVANRHGQDWQNVGGRTFDYFTGSLEGSTQGQQTPRHSAVVRPGCTWAEHALFLGFLDRDVLSGTRRADLLIPWS